MQQTESSRKNIVWVSVSKLLLDKENPRLPLSAKRSNQNELSMLYERDFDLLPIGRSMADNGYFIEEPLIVIPESENKFIVVEGNRRLAALKFLTNPELRIISHNKDAWEDLAKHAADLGHDLSLAPVIIYKSRDELVAVLGFRHITGVLKWDPLSKARFINHLIEQKGEKADFAEIAEEIGSKRNIVRDNFAAYRLYIQARDEFDIDVSNLEKSFGVFFRSLSSAKIQEFIGFVKDRSLDKLKSPISKRKATAFKELVGFIHGTADIPPVLTDSRMLTRLGEVIAHPEALDCLRVTRNLDLAYALTGGEEQSLIKDLKTASINLDEALKKAHRHKESTDVIKWLERCAETLYQVLKSFPSIKRKLETE